MAAIAGYLVHASTHIRRGTPEELLWTCHLGALGAGAGLVGSWPVLTAVGVEWLVLGNLLWLIEMGLGGQFLPTTLLTHWGGLAAGLYGLWVMGVPAGAWRVSTVAVIVLWALTWVVTPRHTRVNLAHGIRPGLERFLPSYPVYIVAIFVLCLALFAGTESALLRAGFRGA